MATTTLPPNTKTKKTVITAKPKYLGGWTAVLSPHFLSREKQTEVKEPEIAEKRKTVKQAGAELGQAQLNLRLDFTLISIEQTKDQICFSHHQNPT